MEKIEDVKEFIIDRLDYGYFGDSIVKITEGDEHKTYFDVVTKTTGENREYLFHFYVEEGKIFIETTEENWEEFILSYEGELLIWRSLFWQEENNT